MSEAKIKINGQITGTAWLIGQHLAITAAHCVTAVGTEVSLLFKNCTNGAYDVLVAAKVCVRNATMDGALLKLEASPGKPALAASKLAPSSHPNWFAQGFPALTEGQVQLFEANGVVGATTTLVRNDNPTVIQLNLNHAAFAPEEKFDAMTGARVHALAGMSGSAVRIRGGPSDGRVIGIIRCSVPVMPQDVIYATPIEALWTDFSPHLGDVTLHEWRRTAGSVRNNPAAGNVISNVDEELVAAAWKDNVVKDITVDLPWDSAGLLIPAILRLTLHQPGIARLHVRNPVAWNERLRRYGDSWIALERFNPNERTNPAIECALPNTDIGTIYPTVAAVAAAIHSACDRFVLDFLDERLVAMFEAQQPGDYSGFPIAADVLKHMAETWATWRAQLRSDSALLHHFLALMLTHQGSHDCTAEPSPGAGPLTMKECLLPATIFSLAIAPFLPNALIPKYPQPGNIGQNQTTGHSCGILAVKRQRLDSELRGHQWPTQVVLLQQLQYLPAEWQAATGTLISNGRSPRPTLSRPAPSALIVTCDEDTRLAIRTSVQAVRNHLAGRDAQQIQIRQEYAASAVSPA
jgi:hypothetical protein